MILRSSFALSTSSVRSGSSRSSVSPSWNVARRPGSPAAVRMGIRARRDESAEKGAGSCVGGRDNGRKPLERDTVKGANFANSLSSVGIVVRRGKVEDTARDPIVEECRIW